MPGQELEDRLGILTEEKLKAPSLYSVLLLNDDFTPMDFVVHVLESVFQHDASKAFEIMMSVHEKGRGVCGLYTYEVAEAKSTTVLELAKKNDHPLQCIIEET